MFRSKPASDVVGQEFEAITGSNGKMKIGDLPALAEALKISTDDIVMYVLPWKLNAKTPLEIAKEEWVDGLKAMRIESLERLRQALPNLRNDLKAPNNFKGFYQFVFEWVRDATGAKYIPNEGACDLWELLFAGRTFPLLSKWLVFIKTVYRKPISRDLWRQTLEFSGMTEDFAAYDPNGAWPTAMDDFVEWARKQAS